MCFVKNKDKGRDHKEGKSRSERESQSSIVLHLANFLWYILNDVFLTHLTKAPSLMCNLIYVQRCAITFIKLLLCLVQNLLQVQGTLLSSTCWWFASIQSFCVSVIMHLDLFLLKNCQYGEHLYISSSITNGRSDAMIRYCNEVHMTQVLWVIYSTPDLFVFLFLCSRFHKLYVIKLSQKP